MIRFLILNLQIILDETTQSEEYVERGCPSESDLVPLIGFSGEELFPIDLTNFNVHSWCFIDTASFPVKSIKFID